MAAGVWRVYYPLPSRLGEFTDPKEAHDFAQELGDGAFVVERFSEAEQAYLRRAEPRRKTREHG